MVSSCAADPPVTALQRMVRACTHEYQWKVSPYFAQHRLIQCGSGGTAVGYLNGSMISPMCYHCGVIAEGASIVSPSNDTNISDNLLGLAEGLV